MINTALNATRVISLGTIGPDGGTFAVQIITPVAAVFSAIPKIRVGGPSAYAAAGVGDGGLTVVRYWTVGASALVAEGTPITADGLYVVDIPPGCELVLDNTYTSGSALVAADRGDRYFPAAGATPPSSGSAGFFGAFFGQFFGRFFG